MARYDDDDEDHIDMGPLLRIGVWGACALFAVGATVFTARTEGGTRRAGAALAALREAPKDVIFHPNDLLAARTREDDERARELAETVSSLTADRDRLASRVAALERNLTDLTSSVSHPAPPSSADTVSTDPPAAHPADDKTEAAPAAPATIAAVDITTPSVRSETVTADAPSAAGGNEGRTAPSADRGAAVVPTSVPMPVPRPGPLATIQSYVSSTAIPTPTRPPQARVALGDAYPPPAAPRSGYAIDLGAATNVNTLRTHWTAIRTAHAAMVDGLRPLVSVRQSARPGFTEFHLVAGPLPDPDAAFRLCAAFATLRVACRPAAFDGQRLDAR